MAVTSRKLIEKLIEIGIAAGKEILDVYDNYSKVDIEIKDDKSPLTLADKRSNELICSSLRQLSPEYPIVSEENKQINYEIRKRYNSFWLVDPLDGTKEFIKRNGEFTVNIALVQGGKSIMGMVYSPCFDEMYWAIEGKGAFQRKGNEDVPLKVKTFRMDERGLGVVCSRSHLNPQTEQFVNQLSDPQLVSRGSSFKFLMLAKGEAHLYPRIAPTMEWDTAAAQIILEEAGGVVYEFDTHKPLRYNKENLVNPYFVATGHVT